ncbi:hypothetical protein ANANG_G00095030 [Anguilla anguilla]|uniref:HtrA serine peptidase 3a n=1 Tax=Anguilla anguilla TaxID=7936 RepID=A0A9D3MHJ0_ANGAN|nr:hypothetical protein ANANG_G00095030 [Anguilla anguilla]
MLHAFLFAAVALFIQDLIGAELRSKCPPRCDVSKCPSPSCPSGYVPDRCNCCLVCAQGEGSACGRKEDLPCGDGLECKHPAGKRLSKGVCQCRQSYKVCGSDGRTYGNACRLKAVSRKALHRGLSAVTQAHKGPCDVATVTGSLHPNSPRHPLFGRNVPLSSGSGFIVSETGLIVTNAHVVMSSAPVSGRQQVKVQLHNGDVYEATIKDIDKKSDIATIKVSPQKSLPVLLLGRSVDLRPGEFVVAIGSPFTLQNTVTTGIVSTAQRDGKELGLPDSDMDYVQTDAIINYGNSGGPLVNLPQTLLSDTEEKGIIKRFIGLRMLTITPDLVERLKDQSPDFPDVVSGVYVHEVVPNSPAQKGGIRAGDVIVKLNGRPLWSSSDLLGALQQETGLLLEVRRGNDDLLFNIEPDVIMH